MPRGGALLLVLVCVLVAGERGAALLVEDVAAAEETERHQSVAEAGQRFQAARRQVVAVGEVELDQVLHTKTVISEATRRNHCH